MNEDNFSLIHTSYFILLDGIFINVNCLNEKHRMEMVILFIPSHENFKIHFFRVFRC